MLRHVLFQCRNLPKAQISHKYKNVLLVNRTTRFMATESAVNQPEVTEASSLPSDETLWSELPEPPIKMNSEELAEKLRILGDTLAYHDLDTHTPAGLIRRALYFLHDSTGLPWWQAIAIGVFVGRLVTVPSLLSNTRNTSVMVKNQKNYERLRDKMSDARASGDPIQMQLAQFELSQYDSSHGMASMKRLKSYVVPFVYFASFFAAIKRMTGAPLESMKSGGFLWIQDLTVADPTWFLPIVFAVSIGLNIRTGMDIPSVALGRYKNILMIGIPSVMLIFGSNFATGVVWYWTCSNMFTTMMVVLLRVPKLRKLARLPPLEKQRPLKESFKSTIPTLAGIKQALWQIPYLPVKVYRLVVSRYQEFRFKQPPSDMDILNRDAENFRKAGRGPVIPTYTYNPREKFPEAFGAKKDKKQTFWRRMFARN